MNLLIGLLPRGDRSHKALRMLASSYFVIGAQILSTLLIFPMILKFTNVATLGVWVLITQLGLYISILDAGVTSASIRLFVGPLSRQQPLQVQNLFRAAFGICTVQALACFASAFAARQVAAVLGLGQEERAIFEPLFKAQMILSGVMFISRPYASVLLATQRFGITNMANSMGILLAIPLSFWGLAHGKGLWAIFAGHCFSQSLALIFGIVCAHRQRLVPTGWLSWRASFWRDSGHLCKEAFTFLTASSFNTGAGIVSSVTLARFCGPEGVAIYNAGTKLASLSLMLLQKFQDILLVGFTELHELGHRQSLEKRFRQGLLILVVFWLLSSLVICGINDFFLKFWMSSRIDWPQELNWVMSGWLGAVLFSKYFSSLFTVIFYRGGIRAVPMIDFFSLLFFIMLIGLSPSLKSFCIAIALAPWVSLLAFTIPRLRSILSPRTFFVTILLLSLVPFFLVLLKVFST